MGAIRRLGRFTGASTTARKPPLRTRQIFSAFWDRPLEKSDRLFELLNGGFRAGLPDFLIAPYVGQNENQFL